MFSILLCVCVHKTIEPWQVTPEAKKKASEAKSRGDDAFKQKEFLPAIDAYTQVVDYSPLILKFVRGNIRFSFFRVLE